MGELKGLLCQISLGNHACGIRSWKFARNTNILEDLRGPASYLSLLKNDSHSLVFCGTQFRKWEKIFEKVFDCGKKCVHLTSTLSWPHQRSKESCFVKKYSHNTWPNNVLQANPKRQTELKNCRQVKSPAEEEIQSIA